jgi:hypothetical protein
MGEPPLVNSHREPPIMTLEAGPVSEADLSAYVLTLLDDHLAAMQEIRERLRTGGRVSPGGRRTIALDSITIAESYADRMTRALSSPPP